MDYKDIESIRILPSDKNNFKTEDDFRYFIEHTMPRRGGIYYFPSSAMRCETDAFVLFQYDGKIRATAVLTDIIKRTVKDENGLDNAGYYKFDIETIHYLDEPVDAETLKKAYPYFGSFNQSKQVIEIGFLYDIISMLQGLDPYYLYGVNKLINVIDRDAQLLGLQGKDIETFSKYRVNQSKFRELMIHRFKVCCLCGVSNEELLMASHIKPWCKSTSTEKLDVDNGLLLCANHDKLFDSGLITFTDKGLIKISSRLSDQDRKLLRIRNGMKIELTEKNKQYLEYHRKNIFKK